MIFECFCCDYNTSKQTDYNKHIMTAKHKKRQISEKNDKKSLLLYNCDFCDYHTGKKTDYTLHCFTAKHKKRTFLRKVAQPIKDDSIIEHIPINANNPFIQHNNDILIELIKQNNELQKQIIEMAKEPKTVNNTNNIQFNIHQFLNETCKNAPNFSDFIDNIQVTYCDLENNAKLGFVDGMTKVIIDNLKQLAFSDRPIHCTDVKRETIYVKEEHQWEKEKSKEVIQRGIQEITRKNMCQLTEWRDDNPEYDDMETEIGEKSIVLQQNLMAGGKRDEFYPKIIKNIAKETNLDKKKMIE
jgi:hypothetical protein